MIISSFPKHLQTSGKWEDGSMEICLCGSPQIIHIPHVVLLVFFTQTEIVLEQGRNLGA